SSMRALSAGDASSTLEEVPGADAGALDPLPPTPIWTVRPWAAAPRSPGSSAERRQTRSAQPAAATAPIQLDARARIMALTRARSAGPAFRREEAGTVSLQLALATRWSSSGALGDL